MQKLARNFNINDNFWECNPNFLAIKEFKKLYSDDKSKKKIDSSKIMWGVALAMDKHDDNPLRNVNIVDKLAIVAEDYCDGFDEKKYGYLMSLYKKLCLSQIERSVYDLEQKLDERSKFLLQTPYDLDTAKELDALIANTKKIKDLYEDMVDSLEKDSAGGGPTRGGRQESAGEKGLL
jgi:hypothetical protein